MKLLAPLLLLCATYTGFLGKSNPHKIQYSRVQYILLLKMHSLPLHDKSLVSSSHLTPIELE